MAKVLISPGKYVQGAGEMKKLGAVSYTHLGALYCDCPACTAAAYILEKKDELLKAVRDK